MLADEDFGATGGHQKETNSTAILPLPQFQSFSHSCLSYAVTTGQYQNITKTELKGFRQPCLNTQTCLA